MHLKRSGILSSFDTLNGSGLDYCVRELIGVFRGEDVERLLWGMNHEVIGSIMMVTASKNAWAFGGRENNRRLYFPLRIEEPISMSVIANKIISCTDDFVKFFFWRV